MNPQSTGHVIGSPGSQTPLPQNGNRQSSGQLNGVSKVWQTRSPQKPPPQSMGQVTGSLSSHTRLPQTARLQSMGQLRDVSFGSQKPLPQKGGTPQSI
jgi:hypothetical protein